MGEIITVQGAIAPNELGFTSMHEHVLVDVTLFRDIWLDLIPEKYKNSWNEKVSLENSALHSWIPALTKDNMLVDDEALMTAETADFKASGGCAMLDQSASTLRVNIPAVQRISQKTGVHIITTTGFYFEQSWPEHFLHYSVDQLADHMVKEVEQGIDDTGVRAGHLKVGIKDLTSREEDALKAAVKAANRTGLSLTVHPGFGIGNDGRRITDILLRAGMPPERIILAHSDAFLIEHNIRTLILEPESWKLHLDYHKQLLDQGVNLSIDCFGHRWTYELIGETMESDIQRLTGLVSLIKAGYSRQLVLGTDTFIKTCTRRYGGFGYCRLTEYVIPVLRELGVSDFDIRQLTLENPARLLAR